jgi:hypothetical protein
LLRILSRLLAAVFTPVAVLATAHELFLRNQRELGHAVSVLVPFWVAAAGATALALLLSSTGRRSAVAARHVYLAAGFGFVAWVFLRSLPWEAGLVGWLLDTAPGALGFFVLWTVFAFWLARRRPASLEPLVATLAAVLLAREGFALATRIEKAPPAAEPRQLTLAESASASGPNIYHVILDSLQDELVEPSLPPEGPRALEGFLRYRVRAPLQSTMAVIPLVFAGREVSGPAAERLRQAFFAVDSLLPRLRENGYRAVAFVPSFVYGDNAAAFDAVVLHQQNVRTPDLLPLRRASFRQLWAYATLPRALGEALARGRVLGIDTDFFALGSLQRQSSFDQPLLSRLSFEGFLEQEARLPARGRYTLVHLLLPHSPFMLRADCGYEAGGTGLRQQSECTLRLVVRLLETLRALDRLDGSIVLVHGDHGSGALRPDGTLVRDGESELRTALLVKPAGARGAFVAADGPAALEDIAPTMLALAGVPPRGLAGRALASPRPAAAR